MSKTRTKSWDAAEHLKSDEEMAAYLEAALEDGDPALVAAALGDIARAKGMTEIAREAGLGRTQWPSSPRDLTETVPGQIAGTRAQRFRSRLSHPGRQDLQT